MKLYTNRIYSYHQAAGVRYCRATVYFSTLIDRQGLVLFHKITSLRTTIRSCCYGRECQTTSVYARTPPPVGQKPDKQDVRIERKIAAWFNNMDVLHFNIRFKPVFRKPVKSGNKEWFYPVFVIRTTPRHPVFVFF